MDKELLESATKAFRRALDEHAPGQPHRFLARFPSGSCKTASLLLARYLHDFEFGDASLVANGSQASDLGDLDTHAWLVLAGWQLDVTADQYGQPPVLVFPKGNSFHAQFKGQQRFEYHSSMSFRPEYAKEHDTIYRDRMRRPGATPGVASNSGNRSTHPKDVRNSWHSNS